MANRETVLNALESVQDPELHQSIVALNMVRQVAVEGSRVAIDIALTVAGCPLHQQIRRDVETVVGQLDGVEQISVNLGVMNEEERRTAFSRAFQTSQANRAQAAAAAPQKTSARPSGPAIGPLPGQAPPQGMMADTDDTVVLGIASGKGGVGKSTVTANLAVALTRLGARVGVMDMDIYGFSQGRMFGASGQAQANEQEKIIPWSVHGVSLVSMGMFVPEDQAIVWRGPMLGKMLQQFFSDVAWPALDYLLIDLPPGTGDVALDIAQKVRKAKLILVTTPQPVATHVAQRAADVAKRAGQEIVGVIENMSFVRLPTGDTVEVFGAGGGAALAQDLRVPFLGQIPLESIVREGGDQGQPVVVISPESEAAQAFDRMAALIRQEAGR